MGEVRLERWQHPDHIDPYRPWYGFFFFAFTLRVYGGSKWECEVMGWEVREGGQE